MTAFRGGATIGWVSASAPLASLEATPDRLRLRVLLVGSYEFRPENVLSIERKTGWLSFGGIAIRHAVATYPPSIVFQGASVEAVLATGFTPRAPAPLPPRPLPFRWVTVALAVALWNLPMMPFVWNAFQPDRSFRPWILAPLGFAFMFVWGVRLGPLRPVILKRGRDFEEIKHWVNLLCLILGLMFPVFALIALLNPR